MTIRFSLTLHILNVRPFHEEISSIYNHDCICQISGQPISEDLQILAERDSCDIKSPIGKTSDLDPHLDWVRTTIESNQSLFDRIAAANGVFEISILAAVIGGRGLKLSLPAKDLAILSRMQMSVGITFVNLATGIKSDRQNQSNENAPGHDRSS